MVKFFGPFNISVDRTWVPRDERKVLNTFFHRVSSHLCVLTGSLANLFSLFPFYSSQQTRPRQQGQRARNKGKPSPAPAFLHTTACGHGDTGDSAPLSNPGLLPGPGHGLHPREVRGRRTAGSATGTPPVSGPPLAGAAPACLVAALE